MGRVGIFGGCFDPIHFGHINSIVSVIDELELDKLKVIPAYQAPGKIPTAGPDTSQKIEMLKIGLGGRSPKIEIDERELLRGGVSYTIETLEALMEGASDDYWLVIGMDQFDQFEKWKDFDRILEMVNLVVTTRPGFKLPKNLKDFPFSLRNFVSDYDGERALLTSGKEILFLKLENVDVSSTEIRRRLRQKLEIFNFVPTDVANWIKDNKLYRADQNSVEDFEKLAKFSMEFLTSKGGIAPRGFDLTELSLPMEYAVISSGTSHRAARAMAENLVIEIKEKFVIWPLSVEGVEEARWVVVDYGSLMVHIFYDYVRNEYRLEDLWSGGRDLKIESTEVSAVDSRINPVNLF